MYSVTKEIYFCYGHRLLHYEGACKHLHGHNGKVVVEINAQALDRRGMVVDFKDISKIVKQWINETLDHTMLLHKDDPLLPVLKERNERHFVMDVNPTAESIAKLIYDNARAKKLPVASVTLWETDTSFATYREK